MLSIIIPVYNEKKYIRLLLKKVIDIHQIKKDIIVIDDGSNDGTTEILRKEFKKSKSIKIIFHKNNLGKGAAIKSAQKHIKGNYVAIQDADLEYNPKNLIKIYDLMKKKNLQVVYGSRVLNKKILKESKNLAHFIRILINKFLTLFSNILNNQKLTDAHTCHKVFSSKVFKNINLKEKGFAFCPEITTKISKKKYTIFETSTSYNPRSYADGKKIKLIDGVEALLCIIKYRFTD